MNILNQDVLNEKLQRNQTNLTYRKFNNLIVQRSQCPLLNLRQQAER